MISNKLKDKAFEILKEYKGENPYIYMLKKSVYTDGDISVIKDFQADYILKNFGTKTKEINKIIKIVDWYGEKKKNDWNLDFIPEKIKIISLLGETDTVYHCYVKYRLSVPPVQCFIPKKAVLTNFLFEDYHNIKVDFERYDKLTMSKDENRKLMPHQKEAVQFLLSRKKCILADDQGLGKTTSLSVAAIEGNFDSILIICPASLKINWKRELSWYVPEKDISIIDGVNDKNKTELEKILGYGVGKSGKKKEELLEEAKERGKWENNRFVIVNFDILDEFYKIPKSWSKKYIDEAFNNSPMLQYISNKKSLIIVDEAHNLSKNDSIRYKVIRDLIKRGEPDSLYLATGTPITNNPLNLYQILRLVENEVTADYEYYTERYCGAKKILAKGEWQKWMSKFIGMKNKPTFAALSKDERTECQKYIEENGKHINILKDSINLNELEEKIRPIYLRRVKEDLNGLPEKHINELFYALDPIQKRKYEQLWDEYEEEQLKLDPNKELNKDLLEGMIYRSFLSEEMVPHTIKLANSIIKKGEKVVIACCYDKELYTLQEYYGDKCVIFNGKINAAQKDNAINEFQNNPEIMVFIGNIKSCGVGITLTKSCNLIFNNMEFVYAMNAQMQDRIHRIGQNKEVNIYYQIFEDTQYERMWNIVLKKQTIFDSVIKKESEK